MSEPHPTAKRMPDWLKIVLVGSAIWLGVALVRGFTFALTHAAHGL